MSKCSPCRGPNRFSPAASRVLYELACCAIATMTLRKAPSQLEPRIRLSLFVTRAPTASDLRMRARRPNRRRFPSASDLGRYPAEIKVRTSDPFVGERTIAKDCVQARKDPKNVRNALQLVAVQARRRGIPLPPRDGPHARGKQRSSILPL